MQKSISAILLAIFVIPFPLYAQSLHQGEEIIKGKIVEIIHERDKLIPASSVLQRNQIFKVELAKGSEAITVQYEGVPLDIGQRVLIGKALSTDGKTIYFFRSIDRRGSYVLLAAAFVIVALWVAGRKGLRALIALAAGLALLLLVIIPLLASTKYMLLFGILACLGLLFLTLAITYGLRRETIIAFGGICAGLIVVVLITMFSLSSAGFTGLSTDSNMYLAYTLGNSINIHNVLLISILIGIFGILDDIAITQVAIVQELKFVNPELSKRALFVSALRVGRTHAAALVNTLFFAYVGILLPSLLYVHVLAYPTSIILNQEIFGIEIVRTLAGSIGFLLIIPITTWLAALYARPHAHSKAVGHIHP